MAKIDIIYQQSQQEQVLDIDQHRIIGLYEQLVNDDDFWDLFSAVVYDKGYISGIKEINGKRKFVACDLDYIRSRQSFPFPVNVHSQFEWTLVLLCREMLSYHHQKRIVIMSTLGKVHSNNNEHLPIVLNHKQLGILTKILKIENKRKAFLKKIKSKR